MTDRTDADMDNLQQQAINRRAPLRNGHHGSGRPKREKQSKSNKFSKFNRFVVHHMQRLGGTETKVWMAIWKEERDGISSISHQEISDRCGVTKSNTIKAVNKLVAKGLLRIVTKGNSATGTTNKYTTIADAP